MTDSRPAVLVPLCSADTRALGLLAKSIHDSGVTTKQAQDAFQEVVSDQGFRTLVDADVGDVSRTAIESLLPLLPWITRKGLLRKLKTDTELRVSIVVQIGAFQEKLRDHFKQLKETA